MYRLQLLFKFAAAELLQLVEGILTDSWQLICSCRQLVAYLSSLCVVFLRNSQIQLPAVAEKVLTSCKSGCVVSGNAQESLSSS